MVSDRVSLITGTGRGVGAGIAAALSGPGEKLVVCDLDAEALEASAERARTAGAEVLSIPCDVSEEEQVEDLFARAVEAFGRLDVVANTVAWIDPPGPIAELPTERWHKAIRTNLDSVMYGTRGSAPDHDPAALGGDHQRVVGQRHPRLHRTGPATGRPRRRSSTSRKQPPWSTVSTGSGPTCWRRGRSRESGTAILRQWAVERADQNPPSLPPPGAPHRTRRRRLDRPVRGVRGLR